MLPSVPTVHVIGGPNGAGKTTLAFRLIPRLTSGVEFVNADLIAQGLSAFEPEKVALAAGRIMLKRLDELASARADFAFESTLAARSFAPMLYASLKASGYRVVIFYVWVASCRTRRSAVLRNECAAAATTFRRTTSAAAMRGVGTMLWGFICRLRTSGPSSATPTWARVPSPRAPLPRIRWSCGLPRGKCSKAVRNPKTFHEHGIAPLLRHCPG